MHTTARADVGPKTATAWHEAGHAIAAFALGLTVRYVTMRPHGGAAAVTWYGQRRPATWRDAGATYLAGMAAEQLVLSDRKALIYGGGTDLQDTRRIARMALAIRDDKPPADCDRHPAWPRWRQAALAIDPAWSESDVGADMWRAAVDLVCEHVHAIEWLADILAACTRAVPGRQVRAVYEASDRNHHPPHPDLTQWWIPRHTRMKWRTTAPAA